jgi:hypothetical protein
MKMRLLVGLIVFSSFGVAYAVGQQAPLGASTVRSVKIALTQHVLALQRGDVAALKQQLSSSGEAYRQYRTLLEQNPTYPEFLRNFYQGSRFAVGNIVRGQGNEVIADLIIELQSGSRTVTKLRLQPEGNTWTIIGVQPAGPSRGIGSE